MALPKYDLSKLFEEQPETIVVHHDYSPVMVQVRHDVKIITKKIERARRLRREFAVFDDYINEFCEVHEQCYLHAKLQFELRERLSFLAAKRQQQQQQELHSFLKFQFEQQQQQQQQK